MAKNASPAASAGKNQGSGSKPAQPTSAGPTTPTESIAGLEVVSTREGFRRAGLAWSKQPTFVALADLTPEQIDQIKSEPALEVREIDLAADAVVLRAGR